MGNILSYIFNLNILYKTSYDNNEIINNKNQSNNIEQSDGLDISTLSFEQKYKIYNNQAEDYRIAIISNNFDKSLIDLAIYFHAKEFIYIGSNNYIYEKILIPYTYYNIKNIQNILKILSNKYNLILSNCNFKNISDIELKNINNYLKNNISNNKDKLYIFTDIELDLKDYNTISINPNLSYKTKYNNLSILNQMSIILYNELNKNNI
jgi:hypothetical protein